MDKKTINHNFPDEITFKFISDSVLKAFEKDGKKYCRLTASSSGEDLVGDIMSEKALNRMKEAAIGTVMFMNHSTNVPEDVFGSVIETDLGKKQAALVGGGDGELLCLDYLVEVEESNERAVKCWQMIESGKKLGASVTVLVRDKKANPKRNKGIIIDDVEYLETSIVGIPCNRQSWVNSAQKSLELAEKRAAKQIADGPLENEGETEMLTETIETAQSTEIIETVEESTNIETPKFFQRTLAAIAKIKDLQTKIAAGETVEAEGISVKGMFNDILEHPRFWELCDVLCEVKWALSWEKSRLASAGQTDYSEILGKWTTSLDEFKAAQIKSFKFWENFDEDNEMLSNALEIEKSLNNLLEVQSSDDEVQKTLHETGEKIFELAKKLNLVKDSESAVTELIPTDEEIQKSTVYQDLKTNSDQEIADLQKKLEETETSYEAAKAGLKAANEALANNLRQPLVTAQGTSATS